MHPADIKAALEKKGHNQTTVALDMRVKPNCVSMIVRGHGKSRRIADRISAITGIPVCSMWPGRYQNPPRKAA